MTTYSEVAVLIPSHSLEDFPTELGDKPATSLLNAFAVAFHPALLAVTSRIPLWYRADEPPTEFKNVLYIVPTACTDQLPGGWVQRARDEGAVVVHKLENRDAMLRVALAPILRQDEEAPVLPEDVDIDAEMEIDSELSRDFLALGTCWLLMELLTRHMHHYSSYDEVFFAKTVVQAAEALLEGNAEHARDRLQASFDLLAEARERFYPVDCYMLDLCLIAPDMVGDAFDESLKDSLPFNILLLADDARQIHEQRPETISLLRDAWQKKIVDVIGGDLHELPTPLMPLESTLWDLRRGRQTLLELLGREPTTWGRRRFGLSPMMPQILQKNGYHSALHFLLDDGIYPDKEQSRMRWEGCDSSSMDSYSRIPLAAESATSWLRFPQRLAETMQSDQVAALILARWPDVKSPFFRDLQRMQKYAPVLGRFVTFNEFFTHTDDPSGSWSESQRDYLSPFFVQAVARRETDAISRFVQHSHRMVSFGSAAWQHHMATVLMGRPLDDAVVDAVQDKVEAAGPDAFESIVTDRDERLAAAVSAVGSLAETGSAKLARVIMHGAGNQPGWLCVNPLSFTRRVVVDLQDASGPPEVKGPVKCVQFDDQRRQVLVEIPPAGFAWIPDDGRGTGNSASSVPLAAENLLQNEFFEASISDVTGGLARIKKHGRQPNRLSQQLAYRFAREVTVRRGEGEDQEVTRTYYSEMRVTSSRVTCTGPSVGELVTTGEILDPSNASVLAEFRQTFRVWRGLPYLVVNVEITPRRLPDGDPWGNFYCARFAWNDSTAVLSQSIQGAAQPVRMERIESADFLEIASDNDRTTIIPGHLPFHRRTGPRMVDSILIAEGETRREFEFHIAIDENYPLRTSRNALDPVIARRTETGPPRAGQTGWFYSLASPCVQVLRLSALKPEPFHLFAEGDDAASHFPAPPAARPTEAGFALLLQETEGRYQSVYIELFRTPVSARIRDFTGVTASDVVPSAEGVLVDFSPFALVELEVRFE